jgi:phosphonate transport system substrate-binding protein
MQRRKLLTLGTGIGLSMATPYARCATAPLRIGLTAVILADQSAFLARWSDYLAVRLGSPVVFVARESYQGILDLLFADQLDAAWICGYPYVLHQAQLQLLAVSLYQAAPLYQSYLITGQGAAATIKGWGDLKQHVLAYSDPLSNSGWLVAQAQMRAVGLSSRDLRREFFAHGHRNVAEAVAAGLAHAGCIDGYVWETMQLQKMPLAAKTQVVWKSAYYAFPPVVARLDNAHPKLPKLGQSLMAMQDDLHGLELLRALNLTGFTKATPAMYDSIKKLATSVGAARA